MSSRAWSVAPLAAALLAILAAAPVASGQGGTPGGAGTSRQTSFLHEADTTRLVDPKLDGGQVTVQYTLDHNTRNPYAVTIEVADQNGKVLKTLFHGLERALPKPTKTHVWDCRRSSGKLVDPGSYTIKVTAIDATSATRSIEYPLDIVRLGITAMSNDSTAATGVNEWQTVYFRKHGTYAFYATPATGEYLSTFDAGQFSDLDLNDGSPRPSPAVHALTDEPAMELSGSTWVYEDDSFNYPLCDLAGATPQLTLTFGTSCIRSDGWVAGVNYPVNGLEMRCMASSGGVDWTTTATNITPGGTQVLQGPALSTEATREDRAIDFRWQWRPVGATEWTDAPGKFSATRRWFTILDKPYWATGATGTQYSGPWVEVLQYLYDWKTALGITCDTTDHLVEALIKGCFGQQGSITTALEDVHYDCPSEGGDGGAIHYCNGNYTTLHLSKLLNAKASGDFVNCTDCACFTSTMLSMLGVSDMKLDHLGGMTLRAIWGIGCNDYTLDLWSNGGRAGHGFSYHHIIKRIGYSSISDACLCVDEDGSPDVLPGTPGWNTTRDWSSYESLVAKGNVTWYTEKIPKLD